MHNLLDPTVVGPTKKCVQCEPPRTLSGSVVTIASEPASIDYDRSFEKNRDVDVDSMSHGYVD